MELIEKQVAVVYKKLKNRSIKGIGVVAAFFLISLAVVFIFPESVELSGETKLMIKIVLFILFFGTIPLMFYIVSFRVRKIISHPGVKNRFRSYAKLHIIKFVIYSVLSILALIGFIFTRDPMILVLFIAGIFFLYFERPSIDKINSDLAISNDIDHE
jgi:hypothetical protein